LTAEDFRMLESYFGYRPPETRPNGIQLLDPWTMNLGVALGTDVWLRRRTRPELQMQLGGSLDVRKAAGDSIRLFGTIETVPQRSYFEQFGRRFVVTQGTVTFNGSMFGWIADIGARYAVPSAQDPSAAEVVITLAVSGRADNLRVTFGAEPSMDTPNILSYIATGRPAASAASFETVTGTGAFIAIDRAARVIEETAADRIGLDVVEIRQDGLRGTTLIAGRYVTPRVFVAFQQPLTTRNETDRTGSANERGTEVEIEYTAYRWLLVNLQGGQSNLRFFFRTRYAF
jgi:translocation and assembly module TamB